MKHTLVMIAIIFALSSWEDPRLVSLTVTRRVNAWYRETGDVDGYARIVNSGYDEKVMIAEMFMTSI